RRESQTKGGSQAPTAKGRGTQTEGPRVGPTSGPRPPRGNRAARPQLARRRVDRYAEASGGGREDPYRPVNADGAMEQYPRDQGRGGSVVARAAPAAGRTGETPAGQGTQARR